MEERVRVLVEDFTAGRISRRVFLDRSARIIGAGAAAYLLIACSGPSAANQTTAPEPSVAPDIAIDPPVPSAAPTTAGTGATTAPPTGGQTDTAVLGSVSEEMISFAGYGGEAPGFLATPVRNRTLPGVVVIQEWWGLDDHIKDVTRRFAAAGFVALAPDLYRGQVATEPDDAQKLAMGLVREQALADIQGAVNYLSALPSIEPKKIGVIGFCMGGGLAMMMSYKGQSVGATVVFYGGGVEPTDAELQAVAAPLLGIYGAEDRGIPQSRIQAWKEKLAAFGKTNEMVIYPGAPHAFFNDTRDSYRPEAAADAWQRTLDWLRTNLV